MGQNPVRTPDGFNRVAGGGGADTPTPDLVVLAFPGDIGVDVIGSGMVVESAASIAPIVIGGFGFTEAEVLASLSLDPVPGPFPVADPAVVDAGSIVAVAPVGSVPGTIECEFTGPADPADAVGIYTLSVTTASGKTGCVRVQINPPA